ncbi:putative disease resistance protein RGA1 [Trifolium repens]|nr:putative disease resistance protein RGA1 [Trifolium repens]
MAEALLGFAFENLNSLLQNELSTMFGIRSKAEKLSTTLDLIKAVLEDAEKKQHTDRTIKVWLQQLKDAVYVLDDILDECSIKSNRLKGSSAFKPKNILFRHNIGNRLKEITSIFDEIAERKNKFLLQEGVTTKEMTVEVAEWRQTSSIIAEPKVYGREDDKEKIVEFLLNQAGDSSSLSVYPIVGLGGLGKTTLAQLVYNDQRVSPTNFHTKIWVCVSEAFSVKRILCSIIESITSEKCDALDLDVLQRKVQELLEGKRFLLVLDDVWNKNEELKLGLSQEKWNQLKSVLSNGSKGSSCLVSTRDEVVASIMGTCQAHHLSGLSENECWLLLKQYAFGIDREEPVELVEIGKEIAKKCGGLPLAAQALGGIMRSKSGEKEWLEIKESELWDLPSDNNVLPVLRLSYSYLTPTLKQCFSFCAIFPKDTIMWKEELIHLWMAHGFISSRKNLEVEDVGSMIWNELCQKSFFQDIKMNEYTADISFKMHDLVHDLAQSIMGKECLFLEYANIASLTKSTHHITVHSNDLLSINEGALKKVESLRTLFELYRYIREKHHYFPTNRFLRVLRTSFTPVPSLGSLVHLRYLEFFSLQIETLPDSIYKLQKLETLKIIECVRLSCLPKNMACLQNLRYLVIEDCYSLSRLFPNIGKISCLRKLSLYIVSLEKGNSLAELRDLNLGGKLIIEGLNYVGSLSNARDANLMCKKDLQVLWLSWRRRGDKFKKHPTINADQLLEVLQPHSNLKRLEIDYYKGLLLPSWISILSNLVALELRDCKNCVRLPLIGKLQSLKELELNDMVSVKYLDDECHDDMDVKIFPSLEVLVLKWLPNIEGLLKVEIGEVFPCLSKLNISLCPKLVLPCLPAVKNLYVEQFNKELLRSVSTFGSLTSLILERGDEGITSFPVGMFRNLTFLQTLTISDFPKLKELPNEPFNQALEHLEFYLCRELESLPEKIWESLQSLRTLKFSYCGGLQCMPDGIQHLTSLEVLSFSGCPTLKERCKERTGEDWYKIAHIPKLIW